MSLCIIKYLNKDKLLIGADTRVSTYKNKTIYATGEYTNKLHIVEDKIIFFAGATDILNDILNKYNKALDKSIGNISKISEQCTYKYIQSNPNYADVRDGNKMLCSMIILVPSSLEYYGICNITEFIPIKFNYENGNFMLCGWYDDKTADIFLEHKDTDIFEAYTRAFEVSTNECVGGDLIIYEITKNGIVENYSFEIKDSREIQTISADDRAKEPCYFNGRGFKAYDNSGDIRVQIDGYDGSIFINNGYIHMTNGKNKIKINPDNGLTFTDNNVEKLKLDIATGNVIGNDCTFNNGNFTGTIKSDTNIMGADFYNKKQTVKLTLGMNGNLGDLKLTRTADDTVVFQIYDDITVTSLRRNDIGFISTSGNNTYMLGKWLYKDKEIATQQNIKELEDRIKTLETRLQNLETSSVE